MRQTKTTLCALAFATLAGAPGVSLAEDICAEKLLKTKVRNYWAEHQQAQAGR